MKTTKLKETYYAIRIGDPRRHWPYFMVGDMSEGQAVPLLFTTHEEAEQRALRLRPEIPVKIVRVTLTEE